MSRRVGSTGVSKRVRSPPIWSVGSLAGSSGSAAPAASASAVGRSNSVPQPPQNRAFAPRGRPHWGQKLMVRYLFAECAVIVHR